jgi:uncharacterized protein (TIGR03067 family)
MPDFQQMQGAWEVQEVVQDGERAADASMVKMVIIKDDQFAFRYWFPLSKEFGDLVHRFKIDGSTNPKRIEMTSKEDGSVHVGIYELDGDTLKVSFSRSDLRNPPSDFTCLKGSDRRLFVLKRAPSKRR